MKKLILILACLLTLGAKAQTMQFDQAKWNFGTIPEMGGVVSHTFTFTNRSRTPIVIERVETGCGCTTTDYSRRPVMPGQKGQIGVSYDPLGRPGAFTKTIVITANSRSIRAIVAVEGVVEERVRSVEEQYPVALPGGVRLQSRAANFRYVAQGAARSLVIGYVNTSSKAVSLGFVTEPARPLLKVSAPATLAAGAKGQITITYDLTGQTSAYGRFSGAIYAVVDGVRERVPIGVTAYGVDDFGDDPPPADAPRARLDGQYHDFGDLRRDGRPVSVTFTLSNMGGREMIVRAVSTRRGVAADLRPGTRLAPKRSQEFTITLTPSALRAGAVSESVVIIVNDPLRPLREVRVAAEIR